MAFKESNFGNHSFKSCRNDIDRWSKSRVCLVGIMICHIQPICDFPLAKDIPSTLYENNIEGGIQSNEIDVQRLIQVIIL